MLAKFVKDESGAAAVEYGLLAALLAVVIIPSLTTIGTRLNTKFAAIGTALAR
jgi:pilus assembly protein Flp/PilA